MEKLRRFERIEAIKETARERDRVRREARQEERERIEAEEEEDYTEARAREATWEVYKDDEEMLGHTLFGFAISHWILTHPEEVEQFRKDYADNNI